MARGQADYGIYTQTRMGAGIADPGEAAVRLGSINVFDRRGWCVWLDDFEPPVLRWDRAWVFGGVAPVLSSTFCHMGGQCCYLSCAALINSTSRIYKQFTLIRQGKIGIEFWVQGEFKAPGYLQVTLDVADGVNVSNAELRYDTLAGTISIVTATGTFVIATNVYMNINSWYFLPIKLVIDIDTDMYTRLMVDSREFDISAYALVAGGLSANRMIDVSIEVNGIAAEITYAYIDNFILTHEEP